MNKDTKSTIDFSKLKTTWDFSKSYSSENDPKIDSEMKEVESAAITFMNKWEKRKDYLSDPKILKVALDEYENFYKKYGLAGDFGYYFDLRTALEQDNTSLKARYNLIGDFSTKLSNKMQFFEYKIAKITDKKLFLESVDLKPYKHFLERLFSQEKFQLSESEEKLLSLLSKSSSQNWVAMNSQFISKYSKKLKDSEGLLKSRTFEEALKLTMSTSKEVRDAAAKSVYMFLKKTSSISEHEVNSILYSKKTTDDLRGFKRPDEQRHLNDDIDTSVVDSLISSVTNNFDISKKYYAFKAKLFKVAKLEIYERNVPYSKIDRKYTFEQTLRIVHEVFDSIDPDFSEILVDMFKQGNVDLYPKKGKTGGAFCALDKVTSPIYVLANFTGDFDDVRTLAHEFGHCINDYYMKRSQNSLNFGSSTATAEVASTFFEDLVYKKLLDKVTEEERFLLLLDKIEDSLNSIFRQVAFYNFETRLHTEFSKQGFLDSKKISKIFYEESKRQLGDAINYTKNFEYSWVYVPHFRSFFYVYSYAGGLLISKFLQKQYIQDSLFLDKIKVFLSSGHELSPKETFMKMGIDISKPDFWQQGLSDIDKMVDECILLAKKLGKI